MSLEEVVMEMRREADARPWDWPVEQACPSDRDRVLEVDGRSFHVLFLLTRSPSDGSPEYMLVLHEAAKERPNRAAVEKLVGMFFDGGDGRGPVVRAHRRYVPLSNCRMFLQTVPVIGALKPGADTGAKKRC